MSEVGLRQAPDFGIQEHQLQPPLPEAGSQQVLVLIPLCRKGDRASVERHLKTGASLEEVDIEGNTPLHVAVEAPRNELATVQCLLEHGANVNASNFINAAPLHYVCLRKGNHRSIANILLESGAEIDRPTLTGKTPLHFACEEQQPELVEVLCMFSANTNLIDVDGNTPMHLALAKAGGRDTVKRQILEHLLSASAKPQVANSRGLQPLHLACAGGHIRCAQMLMEQQADPQVLTLKGETALHLACRSNQSEVVQLLVQCCPSSLDLPDAEGNTALHLCALVGGLDSAVLLIRAGADTSLRNHQRKTAFDLSKIRGSDLDSTHNQDLMQVLKESRHAGGTCRQS